MDEEGRPEDEKVQLEGAVGNYGIRFIIKATYDVLPSPKQLHQWYGEDPTCTLCPTPTTVSHILSEC